MSQQQRQQQAGTDLSGAIRESLLLTRGLRPLSVGVEFLVALHDALRSTQDGALEPLYQAGYNWGQEWMFVLEGRLGKLGFKLSDLSTADLEQLLYDDLYRNGWGKPIFDLDSYSEAGLVLISLHAGPVASLEEGAGHTVAMLQAGFFAGIFSELLEGEMAGLGFRLEEAPPYAQIVVGHEGRISKIWTKLESGGTWSEALAATS